MDTPEPTLRKIMDACYLALRYGKLSDDDVSDIRDTLHGVPRNVKCEGRAFHRNYSHVCGDPG